MTMWTSDGRVERDNGRILPFLPDARHVDDVFTVAVVVPL